ncbi:MAG: inositol monophosphatase family protein [Verrucomicrobiae bacterium]|nr:inositol monophosphatase family protein [Verrucomicrobiae bacterium]
MDQATLTPFLHRLLKISGEIIGTYFFNRDYKVDRKADNSPVTRADKEAEASIRKLIQDEFPHHGIVGEEFGKENEDSEYTWIIDPIDGTKAFITGVPLFTTLIGLLHKGEPILGAIHQPITDLLCVGDNVSCRLNGKAVSCRTCNSIGEATVLTSSATAVSRHQNGPAFDKMINRVRLFRTWGDGYGYLLVASGQADAMLDPIVNPWDVLPVLPVIRGSGAATGNWQGKQDHWKSCVAATPGIFDELIQALNPA